MPDTISPIRRAKARLFGTAAEEIPVTFELDCKCGQKLTGTRRTSWQQSQCPECFATHYVLPVNVYPKTAEVSSEVIGGSFLYRLTVVVKELTGTETNEKVSTAPEKGRKHRKDQETDESATTETKPRPALRLPKITLPKIDLVGILRRTFTPFRLLMLSIVGIVVLTVGWTWHERTMAAARQTWRTSLDQIPEALDDENFESLETVLEDAVAAGQTLGKDDSEWRSVLNLHQETKAFNEMTDADLLDALLSAYTDNESLRSNALDLVESEITDQTILFDSPISSGSEEHIFQVDMPYSPGSHEVVIRLSLPAASELLEANISEQCLFTAKVSSVAVPSTKDQPYWLFELDPESIVLVTSEELCEAYGLPMDEESGIIKRLQAQKEFVEQSAQWSHRNESIIEPSESAGR